MLYVLAELLEELSSLEGRSEGRVEGSDPHEQGVIEVPIIVWVGSWEELELLNVLLGDVLHEGFLHNFPSLHTLGALW